MLGLFLSAILSQSAVAGVLEYRGFKINDSRVLALPNIEAVRASIREQIDIVCAVGLPEDTLNFFQRVPFEIVSAGAVAGASPGRYVGGKRNVEVTSRIVDVGHKPVLLHELLHAYHDQRSKNGFRNPEILGFYAQGRHLAGFAPQSHMLQNEKEYFACAGTTYLFGVTAQEPFTRGKLKEIQPEFFDYLKKLFGKDAGTYAGSLTR